MSAMKRFLTAASLFLLPLGAGADGWTTGGPLSLPNASLTIAPSDPRVLYLAAGAAGLYRTTDGGATWTRIPDPENGGPTASVVVHPTSPMTVFAISSGRLYRSDDGGATWSLQLSDDSGRGVAGFAIDPAHPTTLYASSHTKVYRSTIGGEEWTAIGTIPLATSRSTLW